MVLGLPNALTVGGCFVCYHRKAEGQRGSGSKEPASTEGPETAPSAFRVASLQRESASYASGGESR